MVIGRCIDDLAKRYERQGLNDDEIGAELEAQHFDPAQRSRGTLPRAIGGELGFRTHLVDRLNVAAAWLLDLDRDLHRRRRLF